MEAEPHDATQLSHVGAPAPKLNPSIEFCLLSKVKSVKEQCSVLLFYRPNLGCTILATKIWTTKIWKPSPRAEGILLERRWEEYLWPDNVRCTYNNDIYTRHSAEH